MPDLRIDLVQPGMKLARPIYDIEGRLLLKQGTEFTESLLKKLRNLGFVSLPVDVGLDSQISDNEGLTEATRLRAVRQVRKFFQAAQRSGRLLLTGEVVSLATDIVDEVISSAQKPVSVAQLRVCDDYLFVHAVDVCVLSVLTGLDLGYDRERLIGLGVSGLLHDVGKLHVDARILKKPGPLSAEEFAEVRKHTLYARQFHIPDEQVVKAACQHHERYDGQGYPFGLAGAEIDEFARIISIADVFDAMTTDRVYRPALPVHEVVEYLLASGNYEFDVCFVRAFLKNIAAYPVGTMVRLLGGEVGVVAENRPGIPLYPVVRVLFDAEGGPVTPHEVDLLKNKGMVMEVLKQSEMAKVLTGLAGR